MFLINEILKKRKENIVFIQVCFRQFILRKKLFHFAKKCTKCYSVYPSREDFENIAIKLYTNLKDPTQYAVLPVRKCEKRNCFIFDIPKAKFPSKKKYMCFNFILDGSTIIDSKYNCIFFGGKYVNQIDFNSVEKKELKLNKIFKSHMYLYKIILFKNEDYNKKSDINDKKRIQDLSLKSDSPLNNNNSNNEKQFLRSFTLKNYKSKFYSLSNSTERFNLDTSMNDGKSSSKKKKRKKSILKEHKNSKIKASSSSKILNLKKVSFGWVETSE